MKLIRIDEEKLSEASAEFFSLPDWFHSVREPAVVRSATAGKRRAAFFCLLFLAVKKSRAPAGRNRQAIKLNEHRGCGPWRRLTFFACAKESKQRNTAGLLFTTLRNGRATDVNIQVMLDCF